MISKAELLSSAPATHHIKSWSGIIDPKDNNGSSQRNVFTQLSQSEPHEPHFFAFRQFNDATLIMDVGANCGQSIMSFRSVAGDVAIKSFEPNPISFSIADKVAKLYAGCTVLNFGLSDRFESLPIYTPVIDGLLVTPLTSLDPGVFEPGGSMHHFATEEIAKGSEVSLFEQVIELRQGDSLKLAPEVIKIDVEGAELRVLTGLGHTIARHRPLIMTEKSDAAGIAQFLAQFDYAPYRLQTEQADQPVIFQRFPIDRTTRSDYIPLNVFYASEPMLEGYRLGRGIEFLQ
jgi:FkbM family methyltransferase